MCSGTLSETGMEDIVRVRHYVRQTIANRDRGMVCGR